MKRDSNRLRLFLLLFFIIVLAFTLSVGIYFFPEIRTSPNFFVYLAALTAIYSIAAILMAIMMRKTVFSPIRAIADRLDLLPSEFQDLDNYLEEVFARLKQNLEELQESKEYIETLMKTVQVAIIVFNKSLKAIYINDAGRKLLGITGQENRTFRISDYIDTQVLADCFKELQNHTPLLNRDIPMVLKDGRRLEMDMSISPLHNAANEQMGYIAVFADITQRKKAESNLRNQINFSRQIFKAIPDMVIIVDHKLNIMFANQRAEEIMGKWSPEFKNISYYLSKRAILDGFDRSLRESIAQQKDIKKINVLNPFAEQENFVDLAIEPIVAKASTLGALILVRDITEWRNLTRKLEHLQGFTVKLIETNPLGFISLDESFQVNIWNQSAQKIFDINANRTQGANLFEICPQFRQYRGAIRNAIEADAPIYLAEQVIPFEGDRYKIVNLRFYQVKNDNLSIVINAEDVTEIKELEDSLLQAQKMEALGMLTSGIIHDFNNVLSGILGYASLLDKSVGDDPELKRCTRNILISSDRASSMIRQILDFAKKRGNRKEHVDINELIRETLGFLGLSLKNIALEMDLNPAPLFINVSRAKISQVLINLLINARDALKTTEKPRITIQSRNETISHHPSLTPGRFGIIRISDNGSGIKEDHLQKIFEPFFTTRKQGKGTGIGLATVKEIVTDYKGAIEVESGYQQGTVFTILLPLGDESPQPESDAPQEVQPLNVDGIALLVDDEEVIRQIAGDMLKKLSIGCISAATGEEGIDIFRRHQNRISFVILDVELPGMPGNQVFDQLRSIAPEIKILITSGHGQDYLETQLFKRKLDHFIAKPFQVNQLHEKLHNLLNH